MGDAARAYVGKRRTPAQGVPTEIDPEATPPPMPPPSFEAFRVLDQREQLRILHGVGAANVEALERLWQIRHTKEQLDQQARAQAALAAEVRGYTTDVAHTSAMLNEFAVPAIKQLMSAVDGIGIQIAVHAEQDKQVVAQLAHVAKSLDRFDVRLDALDKRQDASEKASDQQQNTLALIQERLAVVRPLGDRVDRLERRESDAALVAITGAKERIRIFTWAKAGLLALGTVVVGVVTNFSDFVDFIRSL